MMRRATILLLAALALPLSGAFASDSNVGTSGAQFLKIGAGARPTAMGEAYTAISDDVNAVYYNPAGLAQLERPQITAMQTQWFQGLNYAFGAFALPTAAGTFGISAATLEASDLERRGVDESLEGSFDNLDSAYAMSYASSLGDTLYLGATARLVRQEIADQSASAWGGDVGVLKRLSDRYSLGLAARHFGQEVKFEEEGDPMPFVVDAGGAARLVDGRLVIGLTVSSPRDSDIQFGTGIEWAERNPDGFRYAARAGFRTMATDADGATGLTVGAGIGFRRFDLDFAWVPMGDLGNTFRYAVLFRF